MATLDAFGIFVILLATPCGLSAQNSTFEIETATTPEADDAAQNSTDTLQETLGTTLLQRTTFVADFQTEILSMGADNAHSSYTPVEGQVDTTRYDNIKGQRSRETNTTPYILADWVWQPITWSLRLGIQASLSVLGISGNALVMAVLLRRGVERSSADTLVGNLAAADFFTSVFIFPVPVAIHVPKTATAEMYCRFVFTSFFLWVSIMSSILTLTAASLERYAAVVHPIQWNRYKRRHHVILSLVLIWFAAGIVPIDLLLATGFDKASSSCQVKHPTYAGQIVIAMVSFIFGFVLPALTMLVTQLFAARALYMQSKHFTGTYERGNHSTASSLRHLVAMNRVLRMLLILVIICIVCWGPNATSYFLYKLHVIDPSFLYGPVDRVLVMLAMVNSCTNPIVYLVWNAQFRAAVVKFFTGTKISNSALFGFQDESTR
ncbi:allatostatin-A receptor-like [Diadema antillarum]|uniref:allatostatin-A receptor-like n=1 Tax=Diadema antillarum TaxID=105358 RepID=UPI003A89C838